MSYVVEASPVEVRAWSTAPLPFDPGPGTWQRAMKQELGEALRAMEAGEGLHAEWWSREDVADLENVLLYNVGSGAFSHLAVQRLVLTRHRRIPRPLPTEWRPVSGHRYTTALPPRSKPRGGVRLRCALPRLATDLKPQEVWEAVHEGLVEADEDLADGDLFVVLRLLVPDTRRRNLTALVKPVVDGVLCALHGYAGERLAEVVPRVEAASRSSQRAREWLETPGPLGGHHFVFPRGTGLQWSPADDRVVRLELELDQGVEAGLEGWVGRAL